jgi:hypothetical protein
MLEIILAIAGVWILFVGKVPRWIVGAKGYEIRGNKARIIGFILLLPVPITFVVSAILVSLFGAAAVSYTFLLEIAVFIVAMIIAVVLMRKYRVPTAISQEQGLTS